MGVAPVASAPPPPSSSSSHSSSNSANAVLGNKISTSTPQKGDEQKEQEFINRSVASEIDASDAMAMSISGSVSADSSSCTTAAAMSGSPVAKRHLSTANISRIRPQSSYSARVLIFDDSDQEAAAAAAALAAASSCNSSVKSCSGLELLPTSPAKLSIGNDSANGSSMMRNLNLTKSSSGGLSGSSSSLHSRGYTALLRKISYQQHTNSLRGVSSGKPPD